jgi:hypothetical protein
LAGYAIIEGNPRAALDYFRMSHLARTWHWHAMGYDGPHRIALPGIEPFETSRVGLNVDVNVPSLHIGICLAIVMRDFPRESVYRKINFDAISGLGGVQLDSWMGEETLMYAWLGVDNPKCLQHAAAARRRLEERSAETGKFKSQVALFCPIFEAWETILTTRDEAHFNGLIRTHLLNWRADRDAIKDDGRNFIEGFLSFEALAACAYAHDLGMKVTVTSDYIPDFLIRGNFPRVRWPNPEWITE